MFGCQCIVTHFLPETIKYQVYPMAETEKNESALKKISNQLRKQIVQMEVETYVSFVSF